MREQGGGHIINVASLAGIASLPAMGPYNATKAAVISISETLRGELAGDNIDVTVVCPSFFPSDLMQRFRGSSELREVGHTALDTGELSAEEIAAMTLKAMDDNRLYLVPHRMGKIVWGAKRAVPEIYYWLMGRRNMEEEGSEVMAFFNKFK
jgi:short-subunit dehydrogenase